MQMTIRRALAACVILALPALVLGHHHSGRVVSVVPALTEALFAIGVGPLVVGVSSFDRHPPEVATRTRVGGLLDPDIERIFALRPDLVVLYGSQRDQREQLTQAGIQVFSYSHGGIIDTLSVISQLGVVTGHAADAERVVSSIETQLADLRTRIGHRRRPRVLLVFGREPRSLRNIYATGGVGFLNDMLVAAGGENVFADVARESLPLTSEAILTAAPDVIVELTYDNRMTSDNQKEEIAVWNRLTSIPAVRQQRVYLMLGNQFVQPGPRLAEATTAIAQLLHPDVF
jgi:iron complex transport system substrate-binding protein